MVGDRDYIYLAALATSERIGAKYLTRLVQKLGSGEAIWRASPGQLKKVVGEGIGREIGRVKQTVNIEKLEEDISACGAEFLTWGDQRYPKLLAEIPDAPALLLCRGNLEVFTRPMVAIVGARRATRYGLEIAEELSAGLSLAGVTVVSGLALGIDGQAHRAALEAGGQTLGVLGCGIDRIYPASHWELARKMVSSSQGLIISEYPPGIEPLKSHFPARNRIIAGLSLGVVVVEAAEGSGALITAELALDYNREVGAVPHDLSRPNGAGCNQLLRSGAHLIRSAEDVLEAFGLEQHRKAQAIQEIVPESAEEAEIVELLQAGEVSFDELVSRSKLPSSALNACLTLMEMRAKVKNLGSGIWQLAGRPKVK